MRLLSTKEQKQLLQKMEKQCGKVIDFGENVFGMDSEEVYLMTREVASFVKHYGLQLRIRKAGSMFARFDGKAFVFSVEGSEKLAEICLDKIVKISEEEVEQWMHGEDIPAEEKEWAFVQFKDAVFGMGKIEDGKVQNSLPKERRIKSLRRSES